MQFSTIAVTLSCMGFETKNSRREFIKAGLSAAALAAMPSCGRKSSPQAPGSESAASEAHLPANGGKEPRRCELLDFDWRFRPVPAPDLRGAIVLDKWAWAREGSEMTPDKMSSPDLDTSGPDWKGVGTGTGQMDYAGYAWFRTVLPELEWPGRAVAFTHVDDNAEVYLNGKLLDTHKGWDSPFTVYLDPAWRSGAPNVLAVRVENVGGPGGIYGDVSLRRLEMSELFFRPECDETSWRIVQLPHDYIVEGEFSSQADTSHGSLPVYPAWYRKRFSLKPADRGKCIWLYFEGVFRNTHIYVNGAWVGRHADGYTSFHVDISDAVHFGEENLLAVSVDPTAFEGWWYEGGGIYRHVWLNVADKLHVAPWGVYVISEVTGAKGTASAKLRISTTVANRTAQIQDCSITSTILDPAGRVSGIATDNLAVPPTPIPADACEKILLSADVDQPSYLNTGTPLSQELALSSAQLWSLEECNLYTVVTEVSRDGKLVDRHVQKFGVRALRFDPSAGFFLNEQPVKLNGVCNHQDFAGVGIGLTDSLLYYRLRKLKELGCNAIRCSHNPMAPAMYAACDELGLLVMDENRHPGSSVAAKSWVGQFYSNTWHVESMVLRDRNHPSVIMWSLWNEEFAIQNTAFAREMMAALRQTVLKHDPTRPVTCANNSGAEKQGWKGGAADSADLLGVNYNYLDFDLLRKDYPAKMVLGSEIGSNCECRGAYQTDKAIAHLTSYMTPEGSWQPIGSRQFVAGGFYWTGFDYRGEPSPFGWPAVNSNFGFLDLCGFPKDQAFYWKAWWRRNEPLVHIVPHWNWPGCEGRKTSVWCFSNCEQVELFLNGRSLGRQTQPEFGHLQWDNVVYEPGRIEAIGYVNGTAAAREAVETTGPPAAIRLIPDRTRINADGQDTVPVVVVVVDSNGRVVPTANNKVFFKISGCGSNAGVGNGDPSCHEPNQANYRSAFNGYCLVLARAGRTPGDLQMMANSDGLSPAGLQLVVGGL
jgi:beta-galactosidase